MARKANVPLGNGFIRERRKNKRLRLVLDIMQEKLHANSRELQSQLTRIGQLQAQVDDLARQRDRWFARTKKEGRSRQKDA